jgi:hypothetical protein
VQFTTFESKQSENMASLKIILTDDCGQDITTKTYDLGTSLSGLSQIEGEIEPLRPQILGDLTKDLLSSAQSLDIKKQESEGIKKLKSKPSTARLILK